MTAEASACSNLAGRTVYAREHQTIGLDIDPSLYVTLGLPKEESWQNAHALQLHVKGYDGDCDAMRWLLNVPLARISNPAGRTIYAREHQTIGLDPSLYVTLGSEAEELLLA